MRDRNTAWRWLAMVQAIYFLVTGLWPLFDIDSFQVVTGPKTDLWLVRLVGALICVPGALLLRAFIRRRLDYPTVFVATSFAVILAAVDVIYVALGVIRPVYLADALIEVGLVVAWAFVLARVPVARPFAGA